MSKNIFDKLFTTKCNEINMNDYSLQKIKPQFDNLFNSICSEKNNTLFIKKYEYIYLCFGYCLNLYNNMTTATTNDADEKIEQLYNMFSSFKFSEPILKRIFEIKLTNPETYNIDSTIKLISPFITQRITNTFITKIKNSINVFKRYENVMMEDNKCKKSRDLIIYRNLYCNKNNYHEFFVEYHKIKNTEFIPYILDLVQLMQYDTTNMSFAIPATNITDVIKHVSKTNNILCNIQNLTLHPNESTVIKFIPSENGKSELDIQLQKVDFVKQGCMNYYVIYYGNLRSFVDILHIIHLSVIACKMGKTVLNSLYDSINLVPFDNYYYESFVCFIKFMKKNGTCGGLAKQLVSLLKTFYVFSQYDYYFYYDPRLMESIKKNIDKKAIIFTDFCNHMQEKLKCNYGVSYPPFSVEDDFGIDDVFCYCYEIPNYFKFNDLVSAIYYVYEINGNMSLLSALNDILEKERKTEPLATSVKNKQIREGSRRKLPKINKTDVTIIGFDENFKTYNTNYIIHTEKV